MAVVSVNEIRGSGVRSASINRTWQRFFKRQYRVITDDPTTDAYTVIQASGIPTIGTTFSGGSSTFLGSFVDTLEAEEESEDGLSWKVSVSYSPYDANQFPEDPTTWKTIVQFSGQKYERPISQDEDGTWILNSAGQPFGDPPGVDDTRPLLTFTRNELVSTYDDDLAATYRDTINNATWNGYDAYTVKCDSITTSDPQFDAIAQVYYYTVTYTFAINKRETWRLQVLDQGFEKLDSGVWKPILKNGQPPSEPALLDGSGGELAVGGTPVFLTFKGYKEVDFSPLSLDISTSLGH